MTSWLDPEKQGRYDYTSRFFIKLKKENTAVLSIATGKMNEFKLKNLTSYTTYEISVAAGNHYGFGEESVTLFLTSEEGECEMRVLLKCTLFKTVNLLRGSIVQKHFEIYSILTISCGSLQFVHI